MRINGGGLDEFRGIDLALRVKGRIVRARLGDRGWLRPAGPNSLRGFWRAARRNTGTLHVRVLRPELGGVWIDAVASLGALIGPWDAVMGSAAETMDRRKKAAQRLLETLTRPNLDPCSGWDAGPVSYVPGWHLQRRKAGDYNAWEVVTPEMRDATVPWAMPPAVVVKRAELLELLREVWIPDAQRWINGT